MSFCVMFCYIDFSFTAVWTAGAKLCDPSLGDPYCYAHKGHTGSDEGFTCDDPYVCFGRESWQVLKSLAPFMNNSLTGTNHTAEDILYILAIGVGTKVLALALYAYVCATATAGTVTHSGQSEKSVINRLMRWLTRACISRDKAIYSENESSTLLKSSRSVSDKNMKSSKHDEVQPFGEEC
jgi:hypothetical protein